MNFEPNRLFVASFAVVPSPAVLLVFVPAGHGGSLTLFAATETISWPDEYVHKHVFTATPWMVFEPGVPNSGVSDVAPNATFTAPAVTAEHGSGIPFFPVAIAGAATSRPATTATASDGTRRRRMLDGFMVRGTVQGGAGRSPGFFAPRLSYHRRMVPEAELRDDGAGLVPAGPGWFVLNVRDARWFAKPGQGHSASLTGVDEQEAETFFPMLGMAIRVMGPGEPSTTYHWETEQEDFLVLAGEGVLIVEGEERPLRQWDFVHCPPETRHAFAGTGDRPFVLLCASSRQFQKDGPWGCYCVDEAAARYNASSPEETQDGEVAYARFAPSSATRYPGGLLPGD